MPATPVHDTAVVDEPWDGAAQEKNLKTPVTGATGKAMYAWYDGGASDGDKDGYPDAKAAWKLPHHEVDSNGKPGAANVKGVQAALDRLDQAATNIPDGDKAAVRKHLQHHLDAHKGTSAEDDEPGEQAGGENLLCKPWAIVPEALVTFGAQLAMNDDETAKAFSSRTPRAQDSGLAASGGGTIAVIPLQGVITPKGSLFSRIFGFGSGGLSGFRAAFRAALADDNVKAIILDVDSPGGLVAGVPETAKEIREARGGKKIVAIANTMAASAAYWLASQADELVVTPSGQVGSIGVLTMHEDLSKRAEMMGVQLTLITAGRYKADTNPYGPLSKSAQMRLQSNVDDLYAMFTEDVAAGRKVSVQAVQAGYGEGAMVLAERALPIGMVDRIETFDQLAQRLGASSEDEPDEPVEDPGDDDDGDDDDLDARASGTNSAATQVDGQNQSRERDYLSNSRRTPAWQI